MTLTNGLLVVGMAFLLEIIDASFGMGYGTALTPLLLLLGYDAREVVPAVLASQLVVGFVAAFFHHQFDNVDLSLGSHQLKVGATLSGMSLFGAIVAVLFALNISKNALNLYIGALVIVVGIVVLATKDEKRDFSWIRLLFLGSIASFNKGLSGGGYGPVVTAGQLVSGVQAQSAIAITSLAESVSSIAAFSTYIIFGRNINWMLALYLTIGVGLSTPVAAYIVQKLGNKRLKAIIGVATLVLGLVTIVRSVRAF